MLTVHYAALPVQPGEKVTQAAKGVVGDKAGGAADQAKGVVADKASGAADQAKDAASSAVDKFIASVS